MFSLLLPATAMDELTAFQGVYQTQDGMSREMYLSQRDGRGFWRQITCGTNGSMQPWLERAAYITYTLRSLLPFVST